MSYKDIQISRSKIIDEVMIIEPSMHWDLRGSIYSSFNKDFYLSEFPKQLDFKHDKFAESITMS